MSRLKSYLEKLVLLPKKEGKPKRGVNGKLSDTTEKVELVQNTNRVVLDKKSDVKKENVKVSDEMNKFRPYGHLR